MNNDRTALFAGVDWGSETHSACVVGPDGAVVREKVFRHGGPGLAAMADWLAGDAAAEEVPVAIEVPHGPVVETLMDRGHPVHAANPKQLDRFRDRFSPAGAKDDSRDARVLADALRTDGHLLRRVDPTDPATVELREWSRIADELTSERSRLANRLREQLWRYHPAMLAIGGGNLHQPFLLDLWKAAPTPAKARRVRRTTIEHLLREHRIRRISAEEALRMLREKAPVVAPGTTEAAVAHIGTLIPRLRLIRNQLRDAHRQIDKLVGARTEREEAEAEQPGGTRDATILSSRPGVGRIVLATLLAEAPRLIRERDHKALRCLTGVAPVTRRSGKSTIVSRRLAAHPRLREAVYHWAASAVQLDPASRTRYRALRARGKPHGQALRSVGDRLLGVACAMLRDQTLYDPEHTRGAARAA